MNVLGSSIGTRPAAIDNFGNREYIECINGVKIALNRVRLENAVVLALDSTHHRVPRLLTPWPSEHRLITYTYHNGRPASRARPVVTAKIDAATNTLCSRPASKHSAPRCNIQWTDSIDLPFWALLGLQISSYKVPRFEILYNKQNQAISPVRFGSRCLHE